MQNFKPKEEVTYKELIKEIIIYANINLMLCERYSRIIYNEEERIIQEIVKYKDNMETVMPANILDQEEAKEFKQGISKKLKLIN